MTPRTTLKRIVVAASGALLIVAGCILLVIPGPGLVVLAVGLGVLATEFTWARQWLAKLRARARDAASALKP